MENRLTWRSKIGYGVGTIGKSMSYGLASGFISYWFYQVWAIAGIFGRHAFCRAPLGWR